MVVDDRADLGIGQLLDGGHAAGEEREHVVRDGRVEGRDGAREQGGDGFGGGRGRGRALGVGERGEVLVYDDGEVVSYMFDRRFAKMACTGFEYKTTL